MTREVNMNPEFNSYTEALHWIYSFSDTERTGQFVRDREDNLRRERTLLAELGDPHKAYGVTHIAGTKGKGSTAVMIAAILQASGIRTGLYTQPDLHTFRERMRVDGELIGKDEIPRLAELVARALDHVGSSLGPYITYEVATALAFLYFREAGARHGVIEVGLGGRLDATNVVEPMATVITSISYDHMQVLGNTLESIAREKAGIIKRGVPVITSARAPEALAVIEEVCAERGAQIIRIGSETDADCAYRYHPVEADSQRSLFTVMTPAGDYKALELGLLGRHQLENATAAVAAAEALRERGLPVTPDAIYTGLRSARWPARLQVVSQRPWVIVDSAHNADSFARLFEALRRHFTYRRLILVLGLMADKDIPGIVGEIKSADVDEVISTSWRNSRAADGSMAAGLLMPERRTRTESSVAAAMSAARQVAGPEDMICSAGSVAFAGEVLRWCAANLDGSALSAPIEIAGVDH
jgi:dihydrofolate synthase/folylpolyglutamate synthase